VHHIELHAPNSLTQNLKLIEKDGQFTYIPTHHIGKKWLDKKQP
jgi:hypothetical protein